MNLLNYNGNFAKAIEDGKDVPLPSVRDMLEVPRGVEYICERRSSHDVNCGSCIQKHKEFFPLGKEPSSIRKECPAQYKTFLSSSREVEVRLKL